ncbi:MAG: response regulator [Gammaproteobacteria bacterium]|nr:response regulator [Gammaproteobacteria bacterium]
MSPASAAEHDRHKTAKPTLLFVDDEKRVLNSMRAMFRRDYNLFLTTSGNEALKIIEQNTVDVVVADQRMPQMSGVEVLSAVRQQSPATVRILLTGYADLDAVEGAMNESEVFRFLSKPCAADELRGTIRQATQIACDTAGSVTNAMEQQFDETRIASMAEQGQNPAVGDQLDSLVEGSTFDVSGVLTNGGVLDDDSADMLLGASDSGEPQRASAANPDQAEDRNIAETDNGLITSAHQHLQHAPDSNGHIIPPLVKPGSDHDADFADTVVLPQNPDPDQPEKKSDTAIRHKISVVGTGKYKISVMVYSPDELFAKSVGRSLQDSFYTFHASNLAQLMYGITKIAPAVLITDISEDPDVLNQLMANINQVVPELVTMVASQHRDTDLMVKLINLGQVYRFIDKPLSSTACKRHVREAIRKHIQLRDHPELTQRHQGSRNHETPLLPAGISRLIDRLGRVRKLWLQKRAT